MSKKHLIQLLSFFMLSPSIPAQNNDYLYTDWMDKHYHPAYNFFLYANNNWIKNNPIPHDKGRWSIFDSLDEKVNHQIQSMILNLPQNKKRFTNTINQQIYAYYASGMNTQQIEKTKATPLMPLVEQVQNIQNLEDLAKLTAKLHQYGINVFYAFSSTSDIHHEGQMIGGIVQDGLNLPHRDYYLKDDPKTLSIKASYIKILETIFLDLKYSRANAKKAALDTWEIEKKLADFSKPQDYFRNPKNIDHLSQSKALSKNYQHLYLDEYFALRGLSKDFPINNFTPSFLSTLDDYLAGLPSNQIKNYLLAHIYFTFADNLHQSIRNEFCQVKMILSDIETCPLRWKQIITELNTYLGYAVGDIYLEHYYRAGAIEKTTSIVENIKQQMEAQLSASQWLSPHTKKFALLKLRKMRSRVGFNHFDIDYSTLEITQSKSYLENALALSQFETQRKLVKIGQAKNENEWDMPPQSINAYYDVSKNQINIPYGILQAPFFDVNATDAINYGGIGAVIGHEISHGFDDQGAQFNEVGLFKKWWTQQDWENYQTRVQCIVKQYSQYPVQGTQNIHLNGKMVSGEAIADLVGIHLAYEAFIKSQANAQSSLLNDFKPSQQFFINYGHIWASHIRDAEALKRSRMDFHPPMNMRVNGTLRNVLPFFDAFDIPKPQEDNLCQFF
jgi:putative endopeptidase